MNGINPEMVVLAREARGWTQKNLAEMIGVAQGTLSKYEIGTIAIPSEIIQSIAQVLEFSIEFFAQAERRLGLGGDFLYRKSASLPQKAQKRIEAEANIRKMQVARLMRAAKFVDERPFPAIDPGEVRGGASGVAKEVRKLWRVPSGPIKYVSDLIESDGAIIFTVDFESERIDGTNIRMPGLPPMMFLNERVSGERHVYNMAHELGHLVMHFAISSGNEEDEANEFAHEFLMPKSDIRHDLKNIDLAAAARLKSVWGVSMAALIERAFMLKQISSDKRRRLYTQMNARRIRKQEPFPVPFQTPKAYSRILDFHWTQLGYSEEDMRQLIFTNKLGSLDVSPSPRLRLVGSTGDLFSQTN